MLDLLAKTSQAAEAWNLVTMIPVDRSIHEYERMTHYEDSHGAGSLASATRLSFTTQNREVWLVPSKSYLLFDIKIQKGVMPAEEGATIEYAWNAAAVGVNMMDNGANVFSQARYYIEDNEIEHLDHVGIGTVVDGLLHHNTQEKVNMVKYPEMWFGTDDAGRKSYVNKCQGKIQLLIPLERIYTFCKHVRHAFRGVQHRITLTLNDAKSIIMNSANNIPDGAVFIEKAVWVIPKLTPSLEKQAELETTLASSPQLDLQWPAINVYREQPPKNTDVRIQLASTIHRPIRILVGLQKLTRSTVQNKESAMVFDNLGLEEVNVSLNGQKFPNERMLKADFSQPSGAHEVYQRFLDACQDRNTIIDYDTFRTSYPLYHVDLSHRKDELFETSTFPQITVQLKFKQAPAEDYYVYMIIYNQRSGRLDVNEKKMILKID